MLAAAKRIRVREIMSRHVVSVNPRDSIHDALILMQENRVSGLPVVDGQDRCIGIISATDIVGWARELDTELVSMRDESPLSQEWLSNRISDDGESRPVEDLMSDRIATIDPDSNLAVAAREMLRNQIHHLPVCDKDKHLMGILSTMDLLMVFADESK